MQFAMMYQDLFLIGKKDVDSGEALQMVEDALGV